MRLLISVVSLAALGFVASLPAVAQSPLSHFAVFGASGVQANVGTATGLIGSNGDVSLGYFATIPGLFSGGALTTLGSETINGPVVANGGGNFGAFVNVNGSLDVAGDATFTNGPTINGNVTTGGSLTYGVGGTITGTVKAGKDFTQGGLATVNGNVYANHNADVEAAVNGNVIYGNALTVGVFGSISGARTQGTVSVAPARFAPIAVRPADYFLTGGANVTSGGTLAAPLAPGKYGALTLGNFGDLFLKPGNYYFDSVTLTGSDTIHLLNLTANNRVRIFVSGAVNIGNFVGTKVNESSISAANQGLASQVLWETKGGFNSASDQFGSVFAPNANITFGNFDTIYGALVSGQLVILPGSNTVNFVGNSDLGVPEPGPLALLISGGLCLAGFLRRRRGTFGLSGVQP